jgi:hypothetical protein
MALDTVATPTIVADNPFNEKVYWAVTGLDADASTAIDIVAAPGVGKSLYITGVLITSIDADAFPRLQDGDATLLFGPFYSATTCPVIPWKFEHPLKVTANKSIALKAAAAGNVSVYVEGFTARG